MQTFTTTAGPSAAESTRFGRHVAKVELLATLTSPGRPLGLLGVVLALAGAVNAALLGAGWPVVVGVLVGGLLGWLTLIWVLTWLAEARACQRADASWRYETASGAVAVGLRSVDQQTGGWLLQSMAARPRGSGAGSELMRLVCAQADDAGATIALVAVTGRVADWYLQFGFRRVSRTLPLAQWRMERAPKPKAGTAHTSRTVL